MHGSLKREIAMNCRLQIIGIIAAVSILPLTAAAQEAPAIDQSAPPMMGGSIDQDSGYRPGAWGWHLHRGRFPGMTPDKWCTEAFARRAGYLAYLGARLELTAQQEPLWDAYQQAAMKAGASWRQVCLDNSTTPQNGLTVLERRDRMEKMLTARLDGMRATRPPLEALYQSLTPEQRALVDRVGGQRPMPGR